MGGGSEDLYTLRSTSPLQKQSLMQLHGASCRFDSTIAGIHGSPSLEGSQPVDSGDGLPVSAEPGLTHDIIVSRTSVRPKACNQVTERWKGGGLESPPTNKLHMSTSGERKFSRSGHVELSEFIMTTKTIHGNSQFQKPSSLR
ncbi:hypothetical protein RB195_006241 [Necator americanus]|uniref:Uncharacterized protein n=1 Tax=Necator americanus TaxID=51031 RepID=A0ABR1BUM5_NECAM